MHPQEVSMSLISRRSFLTTTATAAGGIALGCSDRSIVAPPLAQLAGGPLPDPATCGIEHVIVFMMENRSFDHFLGWVPGADSQQAGLVYPDRDGTPRSTFRLGGVQGRGHPHPDHSQKGGLGQLARGAHDGWLRSGTNDQVAIGYY